MNSQEHDTTGSLAPHSLSLQTLGDETPTAGSGLLPEGYEYLGELGRGGMGVVYRARHLRLNRVCALKMILAGGHASAAEIERFQTEAKAIARVQHPGIVQVFEVGEHFDTGSGAINPFMALEYCAGGSLDALLAKNPLEPREAAELVQALAEAMQVAHNANVIHRDLKPANVLLAGERGDVSQPVQESAGLSRAVRLEPKITDFGLAKKFDEAGQTRTGSILGTPSYMPPEQARGKRDIGPAADIYALGAILYACLTGRPPFRAATVMETLLQVVHAEPVRVRDLNPAVPVDLNSIVHRCLQKDPQSRYASAADLAEDLRRFLNHEPVRARPVGSLERGWRWVKRNPVIATLTTAVLLVLAVGIVASWMLTLWALAEKGKADQRAEAENTANLQAQTARRQADNEAAAARTAETRAAEQLRRSEGLVYASKLALADGAHREGLLGVAFDHLEARPWDQRGWEHHHLWSHFSPQLCISPGFDKIDFLAIDPSGKRLLVGKWLYAPLILDAQTGQLLLKLVAGGSSCRCGAFSPDGSRVLLGAGDKMVRLLDAQTGELQQTLKGHLDGVEAVDWSPDGTQVLSASSDRTVRIWNATTGALLRTLSDDRRHFTSAVFSSDGKLVAASCQDRKTSKNPGVVHLWEAETGKLLRTLSGHTQGIRNVVFHPDGKRIASAGYDATARIWDRESGQELLTFRGHSTAVNSVQISPDGRRMLTSGADWCMKVWDPDNGREEFSIPVRFSVQIAFWSPDGTRIFNNDSLSSRKAIVAIWDARRGISVRRFPFSDRHLQAGNWHPDSKHFILGSRDHPFKIWHVERYREVRDLTPLVGSADQVMYSPDGRQILAYQLKESTVRVWDEATGQQRFELEGVAAPLVGVIWSPDGKQLLTLSSASGGNGPGLVQSWDGNTGQEQFTIKGLNRGIPRVAFHPEGKLLVTSAESDLLVLRNAGDGTERLRWQAKSPVQGVAFSPDGHRVLSVGSDRTLFVWDLHLPKDKPWSVSEALQLEGHTSSINTAVWSPDGKRIASAGFDRSVFLWDAELGIPTLIRRKHSQSVYGLAWSRDGQYLLSADQDFQNRGETILWEANRRSPNLVHSIPASVMRLTKFSPDENRLAFSTPDHTVRVHDILQCREIARLKGDGRAINCLAWSADGRQLLLGKSKSADAEQPGDVCIWNVQQEDTPPLSWTSGLTETRAIWSPDGTQIAVGGGKTVAQQPKPVVIGEIQIRSAQEGRLLRTFSGHADLVTSLDYHPNGTRLVTGSLDQTVRIWDCQTGHQVLLVHTPKKAVTCVAYSPDGKRILTGTRNASVTLWNAETGKETWTFPHCLTSVKDVAFSSDGQFACAWTSFSGAFAWTMEGNTVDPVSLLEQGKMSKVPGNSTTWQVSPDTQHTVFTNTVLDRQQSRPWLLPEREERNHYHTEQAALAEKEGKWFAAAFHLGRLLLDDAENAELKNRREEFLKKQREAQP